MILLWTAVALAQDTCADLGAAAASISAAIQDIEIDRAREGADTALAALDCQQEPVNSLVLTTVLQLAGAVSVFQGDEAGADALFARAAAVSPTARIDAIYGEDVSVRYEEVRQRILETTPGSLTLEGEVEAWVDGRPVDVGATLEITTGDHLLQWRQDDGSFGSRTVRIEAGEARSLPVGSTMPQPVAERQDRSPLRIAGAAALVVSGGLLASAAIPHAAFQDETDPASLEGLQTQTNALTATGAVVGVVGGALIVVGGRW